MIPPINGVIILTDRENSSSKISLDVLQEELQKSSLGSDPKDVLDSPWSQNVPEIEVNPSVKVSPYINHQQFREMQRLWQLLN